jgi:putative FmdB family regulatory protein
MPLYEYECKTCEVLVELVRPVDAPRTEKCEECGGTLSRIPSAPGGFRGLPTPRFH